MNTPKFLILCYHRIGLGGIPLYSEMLPKLFEQQISYLTKHYNIVSLQDVCEGLRAPAGAASGVAITFDDGYRDLYDYAFPILKKYKTPATIFLIADSVDSGQVGWYDRIFLALQKAPAGTFETGLEDPMRFELDSRESRLRAAIEIIRRLRTVPNAQRIDYCSRLEGRVNLPSAELEGRMLTWRQISEMQGAGIEFGSHTITHAVVGQLNSSELERELLGSKQRLEMHLGTEVRDFAFPFGHSTDCGTTAARLLPRYGYRSALTTVPGVNRYGVDAFALRRVQIGQEHTVAMLALLLNQQFLFDDGESPRTLLPDGIVSKPHASGGLPVA